MDPHPQTTTTGTGTSIKEINDWLKYYNRANGRVCTPSFHRFGVRTTRGVQSHHLSQWRQSEPISDMVHLNDYMRVRMGQAVIKHFRGKGRGLALWIRSTSSNRLIALQSLQI